MNKLPDMDDVQPGSQGEVWKKILSRNISKFSDVVMDRFYIYSLAADEGFNFNMLTAL